MNPNTRQPGPGRGPLTWAAEIPEPDRPGVADEASRRVALVRLLDRLADAGGEDQPDPERRADRVCVRTGDVVLAPVGRGKNRWRYCAVVEPTPDTPVDRVRVAHLSPSALDKAQRTWGAAAGLVTAHDYPRRRAHEAFEQHHGDATARIRAAELAQREAMIAQAVAAECRRRAWAAVVPVQYNEMPTNHVHLADPAIVGWAADTDRPVLAPTERNPQ